MSKPQSRQEFRTCADPRRHVPRVVYVDNHPDHVHPVWQLSIYDHADKHHIRCLDTWVEARQSASQWVRTNRAHGIKYGPQS